MFRWISEKLANSPGEGNTPRSSPRRLAEHSNRLLNAAFASDPAEWEQGFDKCWNRAERLLDKPICYPEKDITFEEMQELMALVHRMTQFLMMEVNAQPEPAIGAILDRFFTHQILERVLDWTHQAPDFLKPSCQLSLIRTYEQVMEESHSQNHCILVHKPILIPLLRLFDWCRKPESQMLASAHRDGQPSKTDHHFVVLLNKICMKMAKDATLLHFFFTCTDEFMVFSLLIPFLYEMNDVGQLARDALLLILAVSSKQQEVAEFVAYKSAFCPVVATGLGGCFSQLSFVLAGDGAERVLPEAAATSLANFHVALLFCNAVVQVSHEAVVAKIAEYFYSGFLALVVKPALLQQDDRDAVAAATVYLQVILETLTETALVRTVLRLLLVEREEEGEVVEEPPVEGDEVRGRRTMVGVLVDRVAAGDKLSVVTLSLLERLLDLACEDAMLVLALRPLLSMRGVSRAQVSRVRERSFAASAAARLLAAVPTAMLSFPEVCSPSSLDVYVQEAAEAMDERVKACEGWKWRYDGVSPPASLFRSDSDDEGHTPFTRLSSVRSSFAGREFNRYFSSDSARSGGHLTAESLMGRQLGELGESPPRSSSGSMGSDGMEDEEDAEFVLPKMTASALMQSSMVDYLTLTAYESLSESDGGGEMIIIEDSKAVPSTASGPSSSSAAAAAATATDAASISSSSEADSALQPSEDYGAEVFEEWENIKDDLGAFKQAMDALPMPQKEGKERELSFDELKALIHSRNQYLDECRVEEEERESRLREVEEEELRLRREREEARERGGEGERAGGGWRGQSIEESGGTALLPLLLQQLRTMDDHSMAFNLQLCSFLYSLSTFPQPLLVLALFGGEEGVVTILESLKERIDKAVAGLDGADMWIRRALRNLAHRADRIERAPDAATPRSVEGMRSDASRDVESSHGGGHAPLTRARPFGGSARRYGFRYHSHLAVDPESAREDARAKDVAHAAILAASLCQMLAGIALHQSVVVY